MRHPQFSLKTLLWLMACVAAAFAGEAWQRSADHDERRALKSNIRSLEAENEKLEAALDTYGGAMEITTLVFDPDDDMPLSQFPIRALLIVILAAACFQGGVHFERRRSGRASTTQNHSPH